jgi:cytochrome b561
MNYLIAFAFVAILGSLGAALFFMLRMGQKEEDGKSKRMAYALAYRVGFSVLLFACILLAWKLGYIKPTGLPTRP